MNPLRSSKNDEITQDLVPALIKCFGIIFIGYIFGRFQILPNHGRKGLGIFLQNLALPVLIFYLVATITFESVNWTFVASVFVAKAILFFAVALISMILIKPINVGKAGLYAIAATQSNDFALGYPLLVSLYQNTHSNYASLLYLTAPVQVLLLNPAGFFMLEIYKQTQDEPCEKKNSFIGIIKGIFSNPIVFMTVLGIIWNFSFSHTIPLPIAQLVHAISSAFPATALFLLGHSMTGKISTFKGYFMLTPILLSLAKNLILPIVLQRIILMLTQGLYTKEIQDLSSLGFLYGTIPCAPAVFVFACQYDLSVDIIASTVIFSTLFSAPIMFVSATMASLSMHGFGNVTSYMQITIGYISSISLVSCLWLLIMFAMGSRWRTASYSATTYLVLAQLITSLGGILCFSINTKSEGILYAQYVMTTGGILSTRICAVFLAILLFLAQWKGIHLILRPRCIVNTAGFVTSFGVAFVLACSLLSYKTPAADSSPNFQLGYAQILLTSVVTLLCLIMTVVCLMLQHKCKSIVHPKCNCETSKSAEMTNEIIQNECQQNSTTNYKNSESQVERKIYQPKCSTSHSVSYANRNDVSSSCKYGSINTEDIDNNCTVRTTSSINSDPQIHQIVCDEHFTGSREQRRLSQNDIELHQNLGVNSEENKRILKHIMLLVVLSLSMLVTFFVCLWKLFLEAANGIFVELEFLDIALNYGQGILYFLIFGLDSTVIRLFVKLRQYIQNWNLSHTARNNLASEA